MADSHGAEISVFAVGPAASAGTGCVCFIHMHGMPRAERDVFAEKGKIDHKHMAGAELQGLVLCYSPGLAELLGLQV